jgi:hypothetical protein
MLNFVLAIGGRACSAKVAALGLSWVAIWTAFPSPLMQRA